MDEDELRKLLWCTNPEHPGQTMMRNRKKIGWHRDVNVLIQCLQLGADTDIYEPAHEDYETPMVYMLNQKLPEYIEATFKYSQFFITGCGNWRWADELHFTRPVEYWELFVRGEFRKQLESVIESLGRLFRQRTSDEHILELIGLELPYSDYIESSKSVSYYNGGEWNRGIRELMTGTIVPHVYKEHLRFVLGERDD